MQDAGLLEQGRQTCCGEEIVDTSSGDRASVLAVGFGLKRAKSISIKRAFQTIWMMKQ